MTFTNRFHLSGVGIISPFGSDVGETWSRLLAGEQVFRPVTAFPTDDLNHHLGGQIEDAAVLPLLPSQRFRRLPRYNRFIIAAVARCLQDAGLEPGRNGLDPSRIGLFLGTSRGPLECAEDITLALVRGRPREVDPVRFQETVLNAPLGHLSIHYRITGPCVALSNGATSSSTALDMALQFLRRGALDVALVGGGEALTRAFYRAMADLHVLSPNRGTRECTAPFARDRNGIILSEGAVFLAVESEASLAARGKRPLAEVKSVESTTDGFSFYRNRPDGAGFAAAVRKALQAAGLEPRDADLYLANAGGEREMDLAEARGLMQVLGQQNPDIPVTSLRGALGDMGAAGLPASLAMAARALSDGRIPPTAPQEDLELCAPLDVVREPRDAHLENIVISGAGWGGLNSAVVLGRVAS